MRSLAKLALAAGLAAPASAQVIDFETVPSIGNPIYENTPLVVGEFQFVSQHFHTIDTTDALGIADNGSVVFIGHEGGSAGRMITMTRVDVAPFDVHGLDAGEIWVNGNPNFPNASAVRVTGHFAAGGSITQFLPLDGLLDGSGGIDDFQSFVLLGFTDLSSFEMNGVDGAMTENFAFGVDDILLAPENGVPLCFGDGSGAPCGCLNESPPGAGGCLNSLSVAASLTMSGTPDTTADTMSLTCSGVRAQPGLFFQGNNFIAAGSGSPFGDGIRCCGAGVVRIQVVVPPGPEPATAQMTESVTNGPPGTVSPGDTKCYQYWYRDPGGSPCGSNFNLSNAVRVTWL